MARILLAVFCIILANTVYSEKPKVSELGVEFIEDIAQFRSNFPNVKLIPLQQFGASDLSNIRYTLGNRISSDRLVAQGSNSIQYPSPQNVQLRLNYPQSGQGAVVTFVEILVSQSNGAVGNAYLISGGIGQRSIGVLVEAQRTTNFAWRAAIYGY